LGSYYEKTFDAMVATELALAVSYPQAGNGGLWFSERLMAKLEP
jgi:hypothetical protein